MIQYEANVCDLFQLVELKNGETYNGHLVSCDNWMNINLREVICTSRVNNQHLLCGHTVTQERDVPDLIWYVCVCVRRTEISSGGCLNATSEEAPSST